MLGRFVAAATLGLAICASQAAAAPVNLIVNGDFSAGYTEFTSGYNYVADDPLSESDVWDPGTFTVDDNSIGRHPLWVTAGDHTTGNGNMLLANGEETQGIVVWERTVSSLALNTNYFFEAFVMNLCCTDFERPGPQLGFYANGVLLGIGATQTPGLWTGISQLWNSGSNNSVTLQLRNASTIYDGNDFALDDLYLGTETSLNATPEPASLLLLGSGLAALARRRYKTSRR